MYFPESATVPDGPCYWIRHHVYRGLEPDLSRKPEVLVQILMTPQSGPDSDGIWWSVNRDTLWVECKAPCHDNANMWKRAIEEATGHLRSVHPDRNVWLIVAIGLKWMVFYWDPSNSRTDPFSMDILMDEGSSRWAVDPGLRLPPSFPQLSANQAPLMNAQRYVDLTAGTISTKRACSLDFWTADPNQPDQPANLQSSMLFLEDVFRAIQSDVFSVPANPEEST